ncbi:MAG: DUF1552 domain-containing protein [Sandaracinus sp.]|nr:DUF1552 domain-containing protein [Sandaracinus sp.]MCB9620264.1 DUF1552 domain-containing protein [Sandaracinus sp.]MCB9623764.1 DUF1552 domain-containing protein [Sandaracinus sp.]MCB9635505.1 DUF1552 domain-containing protein [Sandaracinus sp.]
MKPSKRSFRGAIGRRGFVRTLMGAAVASPFASLLRPDLARAAGGGARRLLVFYFPDGVAGRSQDGDASLWEARASGGRITLSEQLEPLAGFEDRCVFLNGLQMGSADEGSHPGGAKKLLTNVDGGNGMSLDQFLASSVGRGAPFPHLYLGAQATVNGASGDKFISYPTAGTPTPPEDDPRRAFSRLFDGTVVAPTPGSPTTDPAVELELGRQRSVLDVHLAELADLRTRLGGAERRKLDVHLESLRSVERSLDRTEMPPVPPPTSSSCDDPRLAYDVSDETRFEASVFGRILDAQMDVMVQAMACGLTQVGVIQGGHHTSELIMSRIPGSEMYDPGFDMRSHQASHYGARHDRSNRNFVDYLAQRRWWVGKYRALLERLAAIPEGDGSMLDYTLVLFCTEVSDGNTHSHHDMPFVLAGNAAGTIATGRVMETGGRRHGDLLAALATAMGEPLAGFGWESREALPGLITG